MAITPDTKDWTWVLERPCTECGFDSAAVVSDRVGAAVREVAARWAPVLAGEHVARRPSADVWSPLEYGCHVRDVFRLFDERLNRMLDEDGPTFANWDQDATAVADRYGEQDPRLVSVDLIEAGNRLADDFDRVATGDWERTGTRSDGALFTVESFSRYLLHDPLHHLHDVGADATLPG